MGVRRRGITRIDFHRLSPPPPQKVAVLDFPAGSRRWCFPALGVSSAPPGLPSSHSLSSHPGQVPVSEAPPPPESPLLNPSSQTGICGALCLPLLPGALSGPGGSLVAQPPNAHIWPCPLLGGALQLQSLREEVGMRGKAAPAGYSLFSSLKSPGWGLHAPQGGGRGRSGLSPSCQATGRGEELMFLKRGRLVFIRG